MEIKSLDQSCNLCDASTQSAKQVLMFGLVVLAVLTALAAVIDAREEIGNSISVAWRSVQLMVTFGGDFWGALATSVLAFGAFLWALATNSELNDSCEKYKRRGLMLIAILALLVAANASSALFKYVDSDLNAFQATALFVVGWTRIVVCAGLLVWFVEQTGLIDLIPRSWLTK